MSSSNSVEALETRPVGDAPSRAAGLVVGFGYAPSAKVARSGRMLAQILRGAL